MDDVAVVRSENANLRRIQNKLVQWDSAESALAPMTQYQMDVIETLARILGKSSEATFHKDTPVYFQAESDKDNPMQAAAEPCISSMMSCLEHSDSEDFHKYSDDGRLFEGYRAHLEVQNNECDILLGRINSTLDRLRQLEIEYEFVATNTSLLYAQSGRLIGEMERMGELSADMTRRLHYFQLPDQLLKKLDNPTISVASNNFWTFVDQIDEGLEFLTTHARVKDAPAYLIKYRHCFAKVASVIKAYVGNVLNAASQQVTRQITPNAPSSDAAFALFYGKFRGFAGKTRYVTDRLDARCSKNPEYRHLVEALQQNYLDVRARLMRDSVSSSIHDLTTRNKTDHCALTRLSCAFLVNVCLDEYHLFHEFFPRHDELLLSYMDGLCGILYDQLRPCIIHINHLETLAEICGILRMEMLEEHVQHNPEALAPFGRTIQLLSQDTQERLVYRANVYLQSDILHYKPSPGDLAYPEKLEMMERIALSLQEKALNRPDSRTSMASHQSMSVVEAAHSATKRIESSPADLHGMWYPTVRRTLVCLSRLYRCVDRTIFQGLSQEALTYCIDSVRLAGDQIREKKSTTDGDLFEIKHLLILREQIAPFRVITVKETTLDLNKMKTAAFGLLQKRRQLFSLGTNNALLEFLLEGSTQVKENVIDSRRDVDRQLKATCEQFIVNSTNLFVGHALSFVDQYTQMEGGGTAASPMEMRKWGPPQMISGIVQEAQRNIKSKLAVLQRSMQLYLANKDTEFILFRPVRNNIIGAFLKLEQLLTANAAYTKDDAIIAGIPSPEQVSLLINASSLTEDIKSYGPDGLQGELQGPSAS